MVICATSLILVSQSKTKNGLEQNLNQKIVPSHSLTTNQLTDKVTSNQANALLKTIKESLQQPRDFPFQPVWSGEVYAPERNVDENYQKALERHVLLRNFYTSEARLSPEFKKLHELLDEWGFENDPIIRIRLYDTLGISASKRSQLNINQKLLHPLMKDKLEKLVADDKKYMKDLITHKYQINDPQFLEAFMDIRPKDGFGVPDTRIEPFEPLLIK